MSPTQCDHTHVYHYSSGETFITSSSSGKIFVTHYRIIVFNMGSTPYLLTIFFSDGNFHLMKYTVVNYYSIKFCKAIHNLTLLIIMESWSAYCTQPRLTFVSFFLLFGSGVLGGLELSTLASGSGLFLGIFLRPELLGKESWTRGILTSN